MNKRILALALTATFAITACTTADAAVPTATEPVATPTPVAVTPAPTPEPTPVPTPTPEPVVEEDPEMDGLLISATVLSQDEASDEEIDKVNIDGPMKKAARQIEKAIAPLDEGVAYLEAMEDIDTCAVPIRDTGIAYLKAKSKALGLFANAVRKNSLTAKGERKIDSAIDDKDRAQDKFIAAINLQAENSTCGLTPDLAFDY